MCSVFRAPREYNGEEDSDYSGRRVSTAEYVALSGAGPEARIRIPLLGTRYGEIWGDVGRYGGIQEHVFRF